jgi:transposase
MESTHKKVVQVIKVSQELQNRANAWYWYGMTAKMIAEQLGVSLSTTYRILRAGKMV